VEREPTGSLGAEPSVGFRGKAPSGGKGALPPEASDNPLIEDVFSTAEMHLDKIYQ
jgi:hypothetical protein